MNTPRHGGFALLTALIFLVILTLVAVTALRSSGLEIRMGSNNALRTQAFENSETARIIVDDLLDVHTFNRGWPVSVGGTVPDAEFDYPFPVGLQLGPNPKSWYVNNSDETVCSSPFRNSAGTACKLSTDAIYDRDNVAPGGQTSLSISSSLSIFKLRVDISPGAGTAMLAGYEGTGRAAASSGGRVFFYVGSTGADRGLQLTNVNAPRAEASAETGTVYRHVIRN